MLLMETILLASNLVLTNKNDLELETKDILFGVKGSALNSSHGHYESKFMLKCWKSTS